MKKLFFMFIILFILSACNQAPPQSIDENDNSEVVKVEDNYKVQTPINSSSIKGISLPTDAYIDYDDMETGLLDITKEYLNPKDYFYKPGEILTADDANELLARESSENTNGLNPEENNKPKDNPIYINTMIEQNFYTLNEKNEENLDTIAIGFGIDTTYVYDEDKDAVKISDDQIKSFITKYISNKMITYIKKVKGLEDVNILCAFYKESEDDLLPGYYYTYGYIDSDQSELEKVETNNISYTFMPDYDSDDSLNLSVIELVEKIEGYFTTNTGVSAVAKYVDDSIGNLSIEVIVSSYSKIEIETLAYYIDENLSSDLLDVPSLEIVIKSLSGEVYSISTYEKGKQTTDYIK